MSATSSKLIFIVIFNFLLDCIILSMSSGLYILFIAVIIAFPLFLRILLFSIRNFSGFGRFCISVMAKVRSIQLFFIGMFSASASISDVFQLFFLIFLFASFSMFLDRSIPTVYFVLFMILFMKFPVPHPMSMILFIFLVHVRLLSMVSYFLFCSSPYSSS